MKKTILFFAIGLGIISINSCSRGYGCPYTMDTNPPKQSTELTKEKLEQDALAAEKLNIKPIEIPATEVIAD